MWKIVNINTIKTKIINNLNNNKKKTFKLKKKNQI